MRLVGTVRNHAVAGRGSKSQKVYSGGRPGLARPWSGPRRASSLGRSRRWRGGLVAWRDGGVPPSRRGAV